MASFVKKKRGAFAKAKSGSGETSHPPLTLTENAEKMGNEKKRRRPPGGNACYSSHAAVCCVDLLCFPKTSIRMRDRVRQQGPAALLVTSPMCSSVMFAFTTNEIPTTVVRRCDDGELRTTTKWRHHRMGGMQQRQLAERWGRPRSEEEIKTRCEENVRRKKTGQEDTTNFSLHTNPQGF